MDQVSWNCATPDQIVFKLNKPECFCERLGDYQPLYLDLEIHKHYSPLVGLYKVTVSKQEKKCACQEMDKTLFFFIKLPLSGQTRPVQAVSEKCANLQTRFAKISLEPLIVQILFAEPQATFLDSVSGSLDNFHLGS